MSLRPGDRLDHFEILAAIGKGGMGEVYKARDTRLNRDVAIKVSAERFSERFAREAKVIASLNHPNICTLYDIGPNYLVMEYIEGDAPKGPLPVETVLDYARQMAEALDLAHEKGVTHRDLKPANLKITPEGKLKVLDFGLAKIAHPPSSSASAPNRDREGADEDLSPTLTMGMTEVGMILGTAAYMAPEQAKGKVVDKRADIWAYGVVLYEISTGKRLFKGEDMGDILASVLKDEPNFEVLHEGLRPLLRKCLEKDPKKRLRDIADAMELTGVPAPLPSHLRQGFGGQARLGMWAGWIAAGVVLAGAGNLYFTRPQPTLRKIAIAVPPDATFDPGSVPMVSPDGRTVAYRANVRGVSGIWVRDPDIIEPRLLPGTEGANLPFWSPDSKSLAFFADTKLKRISITGGPPVTLCDGGTGRGGTWNADGVILFSTGMGGLMRVAEGGGAPAQVTKVDQAGGETLHRSPWFLPDGRHFLYTILNADVSKTGIYFGDLEGSNPAQLLVRESSSSAFTAPGHLLFVRDRTLLAQPMDPASGKLTGDATPVAEQVDFSAAAALAQFSASPTGVLVYAANAGSTGGAQLTWYDRSGAPHGTVSTPTVGNGWAVSPDGHSVALERISSTTRLSEVWQFDMARMFESLVANNGNLNGPIWSPDGTRIAYDRWFVGSTGVFERSATGSGEERTLDKQATRAMDWRDDFLVEHRVGAQTLEDIWVLPLTGGKPAYAYASTGARERDGRVSPNGRWMAFTSDEAGAIQVYVDTFPQPTGKRQVSANGATRPVWSRNGKELYYVTLDNKLMAVPVKEEATFDWDAPKPLFDLPMSDAYAYDVHPDGRFLVPVPVASRTTNTPITMVLDWYVALKK